MACGRFGLTGKALQRTVKRLPCILFVRASNGQPLAGIKFVVERAQGPVPEIAYVTGHDGNARVGLPPGETVIRFFLSDGTSQTASLTVADELDRTYSVQLSYKV